MMNPCRRARSSRSTTRYPRADKTAQADDFPVPGVPVTATSTRCTKRRGVKSLAPREGTGAQERGGPQPKSLPKDHADDARDEVDWQRREVDREAEPNTER